MTHDERYEVRNPDIERRLRTIASLVEAELPEGWAFGLFLVRFGNTPIDQGGAVFWISNAERDGMLDAVTGWMEDQDKRRAQAPPPPPPRPRKDH